jgi:hypothetical protein
LHDKYENYAQNNTAIIKWENYSQLLLKGLISIIESSYKPIIERGKEMVGNWKGNRISS